ncbi:MAG TPA: YebC/PmpR family DNA-binding transcriptional regulator [Verrucomicrobiae bacterium]|jgi:YebC/PmpR family DNA-binding regulatory protein
MAGHSRWAKVKHFKGGIDAKRALAFAKLSKEIMVAARIGGGDPDMNPRLRMALLRSRAASMPMDNVERAIKKGIGAEQSAAMEDLTYEIYAPHGIAVLVEITTDNRNRTAQEIRSIVTKNGGSIAATGAVSRLFNRKGQIIVSRDAANEDALMELALDAGAEDFVAEPEGYEILTDPASFEQVHRRMEQNKIKFEVAHVTWLPTLTLPIAGQSAAAVQKMLDEIEENADVKELYHNAEFASEN